MYQPIIRVVLRKNNRDISDKIERLRYENSKSKDNLLTLTVKTGYAFEMADDSDIVDGAIIDFQFGHNGNISKKHTAVISDVGTDYGSRVITTIHALDKGNKMKKDNPTSQYKGKTSSDIAKEIAKKYGLKADVDVTTKKHETIPQAGKTDFDLLKELAKGETDGSYTFRVSNDTLYFKKRDLKKASKITYTWGENIVSFKPKMQSAKQSGAGAKTKVTAVNPFDLSTMVGTATGGEEKDNTSMGKESLKTVVRDANGVIVDVVKNVAGTGTQEDLDNKAQQKTKAANRRAMTATLEPAEGNPNVMADDIVTLKGTAKRHGGNWVVDKATHDVHKKYSMVLELEKDGTNKTAKDAGTNKDVNSTQGADKASGKVVVRSKDGNKV